MLHVIFYYCKENFTLEPKTGYPKILKTVLELMKQGSMKLIFTLHRSWGHMTWHIDLIERAHVLQACFYYTSEVSVLFLL